MNETVDVYRFNPSTDLLLPGSELQEGMWVLPEQPIARWIGASDSMLIRARYFYQVTRLNRNPQTATAPGSIWFVCEWADGYQMPAAINAELMFIVRKPGTEDDSVPLLVRRARNRAAEAARDAAECVDLGRIGDARSLLTEALRHLDEAERRAGQ